MEQIVLKSRVGNVEFTRRFKGYHPITGKMFYDVKTFKFDDQNGFKATVPKQVWEELENNWLGRDSGLRYKDALIPQ